MRIAIFSDFFYPELGGVQDSATRLARGLMERGHDISFYVPRYPAKSYGVSGVPTKEINIGPRGEIHRFFSLNFGGPTGQARIIIPTFLRWLDVKRFKPDIIHTHSFYGMGMEAVATSKILKIPLVGTSHLAIAEFSHYAPTIVRGLFRKYSRNYVSWYYNFCDFVSGPSSSLINEMIEAGLKKPHAVISNPINTELFRPVKEKSVVAGFKRKFNLSEETVVYAGRLATEKNVDVIIKALPLIRQKIPSINFAVAGHGVAGNSLKTLAAKLGVEKNIKFMGSLSHDNLAKLYNASEVFAIMSTSETQGMVLLQAMGCGLPAVIANSRSLPEYLGKNEGFAVEPGNIRELAEKIVYLFKNPEIRKKMGEEANRSVQKFSTERISAAWEKIYLHTVEKFPLERSGDK